MLTTRTAATVIGVLFLAADAAGVASRLMAGRLVSAPVDVVALQAHQGRVAGAALLTLLMGVLLALIPVAGFPVFRRHDEVLATGYLVFRGALEMIGYGATALVWLAMARLGQVAGASGVIGALARVPDAAINPYVDIVFSLGALMLSWLLLRSRLVPGWLAIWGLAGAVLYQAKQLVNRVAADDLDGAPRITRAPCTKQADGIGQVCASMSIHSHRRILSMSSSCGPAAPWCQGW
jgi:Domain of unknown function (DUF4386)